MSGSSRSGSGAWNGQAVNRVLVPRTRFGPVGILWALREGRPKVVRVLLSQPECPADRRLADVAPGARARSCAEIRSVADSICLFLAGADIRISLDVADLASCPPFQQAVLRAEHAIPRGKVSTYRLIGARLGGAGAARAVGNALARNPFPIIVPCHRAVRSDGSPGGYQGGPAMKRVLLELEGQRFDEAGRVICERFHYEPARRGVGGRRGGRGRG